MTRIFSVLCLTFLALSFIQAQSCDYITPRYGVRSVKDIFVGTELDYRLTSTDLYIDIYYPVGSTEEKRPLVMMVFGGGFISGKRQDMAPLCEEYAKRGFVAATIDYRIGFDGVSIIASDSAEVLRAGFRGAQDGKSALRFLKARHLEDSIDLERVWVGGASAGSIVALATAFFQSESDKPKEAGAIAPVGGRQRPDLGSIQGNRHLNGYDTKVQGVFNIFGALLSLNQLRPDNDMAVISYHQTQDPVVPCGINKPYYGTPLVAANYPTLYGTCAIESYMQQLGVPSALHKTWIYNGTQHAVHDQNAVLQFFFESANPILCNAVSTREIHKKEFSLSPNPCADFIYLSGDWQGASFRILDPGGVQLSSGVVSRDGALRTDHLTPGMYLLQIQSGSFTDHLKFIKQ